MQSRFAALALWAAVLQCLAGQAATVVVRSNKIVISSQRNAMHEDVPSVRSEPPDGLSEGPSKMGPIEVMRAGLCWSRPTLIDHSKCMEWMVSKCKVKKSGAGFCKKLKLYVSDECKGNHEEACDYAKQLGLDVKPDPPEEEEKEESILPDVIGKVKDLFGAGEEAKKEEKEKKQEETLEELEKEAAEEERKEMLAAPAPAPTPEEAAPAPAPVVTTTVAIEEATEAPPAPAPAPATTEKPRPEAAEKEEKEEKKEKEEEKEKAQEEEQEKVDPPTLPSQGYSGKPVQHVDGDTMTADWGKEYGNPEDYKKKRRSGAVSVQQNLVVAAIVLLSWSAQMVASGN